MTTQSKVAVIGLGNIGQVVAANLVKSNTPVIVADRNRSKTNELASKWGQSAQAGDIASAVKEANMVVLAIPYGEITGFMKQYEAELEGKIIIDPSNPIAPDEKGGFKKIIAEDKSAGQENAAGLPKHAKLVKAFGSLSAGSLAAAAYSTPEPMALFYATNDTAVNPQIEELITNSGFAPVRIGTLDKSARMEVFGDLHEFGALGKTVTATEAKSKI